MNGENERGPSNDSTNNMEVVFLGHNPNNNQSSMVHRNGASSSDRFPNKYNSCKTLQRKLELKVQRAKKSYTQQNGINAADVSKIFLFFFFEQFVR